MSFSAASSGVAVSVNGADNVGKTTQLRWLSRSMRGCHLVGTIGAWDPRWEALAAGDFARWWFQGSTTREHVDLVFTSHIARRAASESLALEDRGRPMLVALCAATAAVKENRNPDEALDLVDALASEHVAAERHEVHVLLRHAQDRREEARLAIAREDRPASHWYADYQHALARVLDLQARRGVYDLVVLRGDRSILPVQRELRDRLRAAGLPVESLPGRTPQRMYVLAGMSESGKSTVGQLLRAEHGATRLKIGYLLDIAAARAGVTDPYQAWDECRQAEALSEEVLSFCHQNKSPRLVLESAHRYTATQHLRRIWGQRCQVVYVDADPPTRSSRSDEPTDNIRVRDDTKRRRSADRIADIADWVLDNSGSLAGLKLSVASLAATDTAKRAPPAGAHPAAAPPALRRWLDGAVEHLVDASVAAVLATGSTGQAHWQPNWSDVDLLVIRDTLPLTWIREKLGTLPGLAGIKTGVSLFTTEEVAAGRVPPRVQHALRLAARDGRGVLFSREGFILPDPGGLVDDHASRMELPLAVMRTRRLAAETPVDVRALYKHLVLAMKILLRAEGIAAETSDEVRRLFQATYPSAGVDLPCLQEMTDADRRADLELSAQVLAAADALLRCHDALPAALTDVTTPSHEPSR